MRKKLCRVKKGAKLNGVCLGLARYFDIDVTLVRILFLILAFMGGNGILIYIICALLMPKEGEI